MKLQKKILIITAGAIMTASLVYGTNGEMETLFDEKKWKEAVQSVDSRGFYAPHFRDGEYFNPWMQMERKGFFTVLKWRFFTKDSEYSEEEESFIPGVKPISAEFTDSHDNFMTWLGHASVMIKSSGNLIIVDPVLGDIPFVKNRRVAAALSYEEAEKISGSITVLLTHNHYDHLDKKSIMSFPQQTKFIVAAGLSREIRTLRGDGADVRDIDWWEEMDINGIKITFLPSQHWSKRMFREANSSLWGSFLIDTGKKRIFICGDSGYSLLYKEFGKKFPGIDYAFMSAGAFHPRWFMHYAHQDDSEAIQGFLELGAEKMLPMHWGSFRLGNEPEGYPAIHIKEKFPEAVIMNHGDIIPLQK